VGLRIGALLRAQLLDATRAGRHFPALVAASFLFAPEDSRRFMDATLRRGHLDGAIRGRVCPLSGYQATWLLGFFLAPLLLLNLFGLASRADMCRRCSPLFDYVGTAVATLPTIKCPPVSSALSPDFLGPARGDP